MRDLRHLPINITYAKNCNAYTKGICLSRIIMLSCKRVRFVLGYMRKWRIKFVTFILGCVLKFRTLLIIRNTILLIICSSLLYWMKKNCRVTNRQKRRPHSSVTPSASCVPSTSSTPSATAPRAMDPSKPSSITISTGHTSDIKCHCCHGIGHF
jgi:hypothetical protein